MKKGMADKLRELGVAVAYLFGSMCTGKTSPMSDVDIGIVFKSSKLPEHTKEAYIELYAVFAELYPSFNNIDIVFLQSAPVTLQYDAIRKGEVLFETDPRVRADFEADVMQMYLDFMPVLKVFDNTAVIRLTHV